jgi:hypothetical protein
MQWINHTTPLKNKVAQIETNLVVTNYNGGNSVHSIIISLLTLNNESSILQISNIKNNKSIFFLIYPSNIYSKTIVAQIQNDLLIIFYYTDYIIYTNVI